MPVIRSSAGRFPPWYTFHRSSAFASPSTVFSRFVASISWNGRPSVKNAGFIAPVTTTSK